VENLCISLLAQVAFPLDNRRRTLPQQTATTTPTA